MDESERFAQLLDKVGDEVTFTLNDDSTRVIKCSEYESENSFSFDEFDLSESVVVLVTLAKLISDIEDEIRFVHYLGVDYSTNIRFHLNEALIGLS